MRRSLGTTFPAPRSSRPVPARYVVGLARYLRSLALDGRGDDARGRHLAALSVLDWALGHDLFDYRPSRDPGRWLLLLLDVGGARIGLAPEARLRLPLDDFLARLGGKDLRLVADLTRSALADAVGDRIGVCREAAAGRLERTTVAETLWLLGIPETGPSGREKHPQGRQLRKAIRARVDLAWDARLDAVEEAGEVDAATVLAAIPGSYAVAVRTVQAALTRVGEDLAHTPFAVFYALLTDARRGGRVWRPSDCFVEAGSYDRAAFDAAVGHALLDARSRKRRYRRSSALAELGLSSFFPATFARIDRWLATRRFDEFCLSHRPGAPRRIDWYRWARHQRSTIAARHDQLVDGVAHDLRDATRP